MYLKLNFLKVDEADLVACGAYFEVLGDESTHNNDCALLLCACKDDDDDVWSPFNSYTQF